MPVKIFRRFARERQARFSLASGLRQSCALFLATAVFSQAVGVAKAEERKKKLARLVDVEHFASRVSDRLVFHLSGPTTFRAVQRKSSPQQGSGVVLEMDDVSFQPVRSLAKKGIVSDMIWGARGETLQVFLPTRSDAEYSIFYLPSPFRLVVDVFASRRGKLGASVVPTVHRVVLDPGHGGTDPGAVGQSGLSEKDVALEIALRAAPLLARELGIDTLLTRDTDVFVPLEQRVAKANDFGADLFVSIHCNADRAGRAHGFMSFVLDGTQDHSVSSALARENDQSAWDNSHLSQFLPTTDAKAWGARRSRHFAKLLQRASHVSLHALYDDVRNGGVRAAGFYVLAGAQMPAVLFESSFISHPVEGARLGETHYRQKLADGIVNAVRAYRTGL